MCSMTCSVPDNDIKKALYSIPCSIPEHAMCSGPECAAEPGTKGGIECSIHCKPCLAPDHVTPIMPDVLRHALVAKMTTIVEYISVPNTSTIFNHCRPLSMASNISIVQSHLRSHLWDPRKTDNRCHFLRLFEPQKSGTACRECCAGLRNAEITSECFSRTEPHAAEFLT
jgi:hypothetical protein